MSIPQNITKEHLIKAIEKIDLEGIPSDGDSQYYDVVFKNKRYPPKLIVSYANLFANGEILERTKFNGGLKTPCFKLLKKYGFTITNRNGSESFYNYLIDFLAVAKIQKTGQGTTTEAKTFNQEIIHNYKNLKVDLSFGIGRATAIPWISFLRKGQSTSNGIYPVFLFYKKLELLILAYGVSVKTYPKINWNLNNPKTIEELFWESNLGKPEKYGNSLVFKTYDTALHLEKDEIDNDLNYILDFYKKIDFDSTVEIIQVEKEKKQQPNLFKENNPMDDFNHIVFYQSAQRANFFINKNLALRFIASLLTKPFVILTGLSGSGKSKLAQAFSMWICENENQYCIIPVGADWTNREPLLGFPNALEAGKYVKPDNRVLELIIEANDNPEKPYFLILDEMNLSHVERYFADFLSVMESNQDLFLHAGNESWSNVPPRIKLSKNLFIIGTVNIDETTYMFSPKVLDRANVIEFRVTVDEMTTFLIDKQILNLDGLKKHGARMADSFVKIANDKLIEAKDFKELNATLIGFFNELKKTGAEFGFRTASEILRFTTIINHIEPKWTIAQIIDVAIMQKLLPKVHGSRRKLEPVLKTLAKLSLNDEKNLEEYLSAKKEINFEDNDIKYPIALEKIVRMNQGLINNGFTSYAEA